MAFRLLLFDILTELREYVSDTQGILDKIAEVIEKGGVIAFNAVGLLKDLLKNDRNPFCNDEMARVVQALMDFAVLQSSTPLYRTEAYITVEMIINKYQTQKFTSIIKMFEEKVDFDTNDIDGSAVFRVFPDHIHQAFKKFFANITDSFLGAICLISIRNILLQAQLQKDDQNLTKFLKENNICDEIMKAFPNEKCCGHLTQIAFLLSNIEIKDNEQWDQFVKTQVMEKKKLYASVANYGGERPSMIRQENASKAAKAAKLDFQQEMQPKKTSNESSFNFNSDSDEEDSSSDENKSRDSNKDSHSDDYSNEEDEKKEESSQNQFDDLMKKIWGFTPIEITKKPEEEDGDEEYNYSSYEEEDDDE